MKRSLRSLVLFIAVIISHLTQAQPFSLVKDINTTPSTQGSVPRNLIEINGTTYFIAETIASGSELWKTDGTTAGTVMVKDIYAGINAGSPENLVNVNGVLYFSAQDAANGRELWKSDGTAAGTVRVKDVYVGSNGSIPQYRAAVNGILYFDADDGVNARELWKSDGTAAGTVLVKDINTGLANGAPQQLTNVNGVLYFIAGDAINGRELWKSDGTTPGTVLVKDIYPGATTSNLNTLASIGNKLIFTANDGVNGEEVWRSDGTTSGTQMFHDIAIPGGSIPNSFVLANDRIFAVLSSDAEGTELWTAAAYLLLPATSTTFTGRLIKNDAQLNWVTKNETNTQKFIIERSTDGRTYTSIGTVNAFNRPGTNNYHFTDSAITALGVQVVYYRLKLADMDGRFTYSEIVALSLNQKNLVLLYPNPVKDKAGLTITTSLADKLQLSIYDNAGRLVHRQPLNIASGSNRLAD